MQHHVTGTAEIVIQLPVVVLYVLCLSETGIVRGADAFEGHDPVDTVSILVDAVNGGCRNRHIAGTSRNSIWCQVPSSELSLRPVEGSSDGACHHDVHSES